MMWDTLISAVVTASGVWYGVWATLRSNAQKLQQLKTEAEEKDNRRASDEEIADRVRFDKQVIDYVHMVETRLASTNVYVDELERKYRDAQQQRDVADALARSLEEELVAERRKGGAHDGAT